MSTPGWAKMWLLVPPWAEHRERLDPQRGRHRALDTVAGVSTRGLQDPQTRTPCAHPLSHTWGMPRTRAARGCQEGGTASRPGGWRGGPNGARSAGCAACGLVSWRAQFTRIHQTVSSGSAHSVCVLHTRKQFTKINHNAVPCRNRHVHPQSGEGAQRQME